MNLGAVELLRWQYLIFLLPGGIALLLLALSAITSLTGSDDAEGDSDGDDEGETEGDGDDSDEGEDGNASPVTRWSVGGLIGMGGGVPRSMILGILGLTWGLAGFWMVRLQVRAAEPTLLQVLPAILVALAVSVLVARTAATLARRAVPTEIKAASREDLLLRTGRVLFPVTETGGRIRIYDEQGTLHDHPCRVATGHPVLAKGKPARVIDIDAASGRLIVEEDVAASV